MCIVVLGELPAAPEDGQASSPPLPAQPYQGGRAPEPGNPTLSL